MQRRLYEGKWLAIFLSVFLVVVPLFLQSCGGGVGGGSYDDPKVEVTSSSVLVSPQTLNDWVTKGYGTDSYGYNKIVVLDVTSSANYGSTVGHVPGAFLLESSTTDLYASRSDGIGGTYSYTDTAVPPVTWTDSNTPNMVATKTQMDAIIQRTGIDANTVVVLTADTGVANVMSLGRAYFNFRYWGFPKNRLKVLDGSNATYKAAGFSLETALPPTPAASSYSVCNLTQNTSLRAPLQEMMKVAQDSDSKTVVVDSRSTDEYNGVKGKTAGPFLGKTGYAKKVAFEGHVKTAASLEYSKLLSGDNLLPKDTLTALFTALGVDGSTTAYTYCRTSWRAAVAFLALDGVLGYPVKIYDGGWIEWGQMATSAKNGALAAASPWRTDTAALSESIIYNVDNGFTVDQISSANSFANRADLVNVTDSSICGGGGSSGGGAATGGYGS